MALAITLATVAALLSLSPHLVVGMTLIMLIGGPVDYGMFVLILALGLAGIVGRHMAFGAAMVVSHRLAFQVLHDLRLRLADRLATMPLAQVKHQGKGRLRAAMLDDVDQLEDGIAHLIPEMSGALIMPLLAVSVMALLDWRLALAAAVPTLVGFWLTGRLMARAQETTRRYRQASADMAEIAAETADGRATFRSFNQTEQAIDRAKAELTAFEMIATNWNRRAVAPGSGTQLLVTGNLLLALPLGAWLAAASRIETSVLVLLLVVAAGFGDIFAGIAGLGQRLGRQSAVLGRIDRALGARGGVGSGGDSTAAPLPPTSDNGGPSAQASGVDPTSQESLILDSSVVFDQVRVVRDGRVILDGVSLTIPMGGFAALVGPSGAGKSTLAAVLAGLEAPDDGQVRIGGVDMRRLPEEVLHRQVATVFQDVFLFSGTIAENIALGRPDAAEKEIVAAATAAQAHSFIEACPQRYETILGDRGHGLSAGERQRLSIARALVKNAPILVLDEATASVDPKNEAALQTALAAVTRSRTLLVIAHRLRTIIHADEILFLEAGRIIERGTHDALLRRGGRYADFWAHQSGMSPSPSMSSDHRSVSTVDVDP